MNYLIKVNIKLLIGYLTYGLGIVFMLNSNLGLSPWDVFHQGLSMKVGLSLGQASIICGIIIVIIDALLGENIGVGTITNMVFVGLFVDIINYYNLVPFSNTLFSGLLMLLIGCLLVAFATVLYMSLGLGSGPRDGLMIALHKKSNKSIKLVRCLIELMALVVGYLLGGSVGVGTVISAFIVGYFIQVGFKLVNIDSKNICHKSIKTSFIDIKTLFVSYLSKKESKELEDKNNF